MKISVFNSKFIMSALLLPLLLVAGCSKTTVVINPVQDVGSGGGTQDTVTTNNSSFVSFSASVESLDLTRSMTPIATNIAATVYAYLASTDTLYANGNYVSTALGTITGVNGYQMYLPTGSYDFYGVSTNSSVAAPAFDGISSVGLVNGVDYLWWESTNHVITNSLENVSIVFTHRAAQIVFEIDAGDGVVIDSLVSVYTTAPNEGAKMNLTTGVISPTTTIQSGFVNQMSLSGDIAQSILLPCIGWNYMAAAITVLINGETSPRVYGAQIPIPNSQLAAGNSYWYELVIDASTISVGTVSITGWTVVDETGTPIYPGQIFP